MIGKPGRFAASVGAKGRGLGRFLPSVHGSGASSDVPRHGDAHAGWIPWPQRTAQLVGRAATIACFALVALVTSAGPAVAQTDTCPNAEFREGAGAHLPDCRAYEMVTPPDKGGFSAIGGGGLGIGLASADGDSIIFPVFAAFPGAVGNSYPDPYRSTRGWPAWSTQHVGPPVAVASTPESTVRVGGISEDQSKMVVTSNLPLTPDAWESDQFHNPTGNKYAQPLYLRNNTDGSYRLITPEPVTGSTPYPSRFVWGSADYSSLLFESRARLTPDAPDSSDWKLYQWTDGMLTLASVTDAGPIDGLGGTGSTVSARNDDLKDHVMSRDGEVVWFSSPSDDDATYAGRIYRREDGETVEATASENPADPAPADDATYYGAAADGSKVVFRTERSLVAEDVPIVEAGYGTALADLYLYDYTKPAGSRLTLVSDGSVHRAEVLGVLGMSEDAKRVYFAAEATGASAPGVPSADPTIRLYVWDDGDLQEIGGAPGGISQFLGSAPDGGSQGRPWAMNGMPVVRGKRTVSADGSALLVRTSAELDPDRDAGGLFQVMRYGLGEGWTCLSCPADGSPATTHGTLRVTRTQLAESIFNWEHNNLSDNGERAFFESGDALLPAQDSNGKQDVYIWEGGELSLVSGGRSDEGAFFMDASATGDSAFFLTYEQLSGWDDDLLADVYVARVGGGLPQPPEPAAPCVSDQCQGQLSEPPAFDAPASARFEERGDTMAGPPRSLRIRRVTVKQRGRLARGRRVGLRVLVGRPGVVRVAVRARVGSRQRIVARGRKRAPEAGTVWVRVRLSKPARRVLARGRRLGLRVVAGSTGASETDRVRVRIKRPAKRGQRRTAGGRR